MAFSPFQIMNWGTTVTEAGSIMVVRIRKKQNERPFHFILENAYAAMLPVRSTPARQPDRIIRVFPAYRPKGANFMASA